MRPMKEAERYKRGLGSEKVTVPFSVSGSIQRAGESFRTDESFDQFQGMAEGLLPIGAQVSQIGCHHPGVVGNQPQPEELAARIFGHLAQIATGKLLVFGVR